MGRTLISTSILVLYLSTVPVHSQYHSQPQSLPYEPKAEKVTNLHFFLHENNGDIDPTAVVVAWANISSNGTVSSTFGNVFAVDDPLTVGPEHNTEVIGNAQGLAALASRNAQTTVFYFDLGFTKGEFNGSSISIFSRYMLTEPVRELAVVGGRGKFRMAKGFALFKMYFMNATSLITEINVTVIHY